MKDNYIKATHMNASNMADNNIKEFFAQHKQIIEDKGFSERLFASLECMPKPVYVSKTGHMKYISRNGIIVLFFTFVGIVLFSVFGGYSVVIESLVSLGSSIANASLITPQLIVSILFLLCSLFALGKFAVEAE